MLENFKYVNHLGEEVQFGTNGIFANENNLRDYSWGYDYDKNKIENFKKNVSEKSITIIIFADSEEEGTIKKNRIFEVFEKDVVFDQCGKIVIGDYYMNCYIVESCKSEYLTAKRKLVISAKIVSDTGNWIKKTLHEFIFEQSSEASVRGYPYGYEYDYSSISLNVKPLKNEHFAPCDFIMKISGYANKPTITIGDQVYKVNVTVNYNEILTIESKEKTVVLTRNNGETENMFSQRDKENYIFDKIPAGTSDVSWNGDYNFEITLFEERSEPKWI